MYSRSDPFSILISPSGVMVSTTNVQNPFTPFGDCDLLRVANILATGGHLGTAEDLVLVLLGLSGLTLIVSSLR